MTFRTFAEAEVICKPENDLYEAALEAMDDAYSALEDARQAYDSAGGLLDDSTFWDIVGGAVVVGACIAPEPFSKGICIAGIVGGGATVAASELDRQDEIDAARQAVNSAEILYNMAVTQATSLGTAYWNCLFHHTSKSK